MAATTATDHRILLHYYVDNGIAVFEFDDPPADCRDVPHLVHTFIIHHDLVPALMALNRE